MLKKHLATIILFLAGLCLICYNFLSFIIMNAVDIPFWDEWDISYFIIGKPTLSEILLHQHNVHRIGVGLLIIKILAWFSNWSQTLEIYFISFIMLLATGVILFIKYKTDKRISLTDLIVPLLFLNIFQHETLLSGFQISYVLPFFFLTLWLLTASIFKNIAARNALLAVVSLLASYSSFQGLLLPFITVIFILFEFLRDKNGNKTVLILTVIMNALIIGTYFIGYSFSLQGKPATDMKVAIEYFALAVRTGFLSFSHNIFSNLITTFIVAVVLSVGAARFYRDKKAHNSFVGTTLIVYALLYILLITEGRSYNLEVASRYVTYTILAPVGLYFTLSDIKYGRYFKTLLFAIILINALEYNNAIFQEVRETTRREKIAVDCYKNWGPSAQWYNIFELYPSESRLNSMLPDVFRYKKIPLGRGVRKD